MNLAVEFLYAVGSVICHQLPDRSFFIDGRQLPVCARCTGLYLGGLFGLAGWGAWKIARGWRPIAASPRAAVRLLIIAGVPTAMSLAAGMTGVWDGSNITRAVLALPLGISAGGIVAAVFTKDLR
jgi:uncharacterized membrane protein